MTKRLSTTTASGLNRTTPIKHVDRQDGTIVLQGFEMGRAFSWIITEATGQVTVAVAFEGAAVAVFGSCTPLESAAEVRPQMKGRDTMNTRITIVVGLIIVAAGAAMAQTEPAAQQSLAAAIDCLCLPERGADPRAAVDG